MWGLIPTVCDCLDTNTHAPMPISVSDKHGSLFYFFSVSDQKQLGEGTVGFGLHFQATAHNWGKSGQKVKQELQKAKPEQLTGLLLARAELAVLGSPDPTA